MLKKIVQRKSLYLLLILVMSIGSSPSYAKTEAAKDSNSVTNVDKVFNELIAGNKRFRNGKVRQDGQSQGDITRLAKGQSPQSVVLSCSDSRVPPETVFDQKLGEMFTVRSAGQALSAEAIASIEYAIANLGSKLIVVLGHTNCGAVKAAIDTIDGKSAGSENLDLLVKDILPHLLGHFDRKNISNNLKNESWLNVRGVAKDLLKRSKIISKAVESGRVQIKIGLYDLASGEVNFE